MKLDMMNKELTLDEINQALDLARERDPSIEPERGYSCAARTQESSATVEHATNLSILTAAAFVKGHTPRDAVRLATELYNEVQELVRQY
jgi:hypothetical protein